MGSDIDREIAHALSHRRPKTCCRLWHSWGRWEVVRRYKITNGKDNAVGNGIDQERTCIDCHQIQTRKEEIKLAGT